MTPGERQFNQILKGHAPRVKQLAKSLRALIFAAVPDIHEYVKDGYSQYGTAGIVFGITVHKQHVNLQLYNGTSLTDPDGLLIGEGKRLRHVTLHQPEDLRVDYLTRLVRESVAKTPSRANTRQKKSNA